MGVSAHKMRPWNSIRPVFMQNLFAMGRVASMMQHALILCTFLCPADEGAIFNRPVEFCRSIRVFCQAPFLDNFQIKDYNICIVSDL